MDSVDSVDVLTLVVAGLSLALSLYVGIAQLRLQRRLLKVEEDRDKAAKVAGRMAAMTAAIMKVPGSKTMRTVLRIANGGPGEARNVRVTIDGVPLAEHPCIMDASDIPVIGPGAHVDVLMIFHRSTPRPPFEVVVTWTDDAGEETFRSTVTW